MTAPSTRKMTNDCWMNNREGQLVKDRSQNLPDELMDEVLSRLPPTSIFMIKCLCKRLYTITEDDHFRSLWGRNGRRPSQSELPFLLCSLADDGNKKFPDQVSTAELPFLPCSFDVATGLLSLRVFATTWRPFPASVLLPSLQTSPLKLLSSAGGLVLTGQRAEDAVEQEILSVINPLTRSKREISSVLELGYRVRQLVLDDAIEGRYLIFAENIKTAQDIDLKLLIYDSMTEQWNMNGTLRTSIRCPLIFTGAAALHGTFYCLAITQETAHMFQFNRVDGWRDSDALVPPSLYPQQYQKFWMKMPGLTLCKPHLFRYRSDLMLVGVTLYKYGTKSRWEYMYYTGEGVHLWKLDEEKIVWKHETTMPDNMFSKNAETYEFLSSEDHLFVHEVMPKEPTELLYSRIFFCELSTGSWDELPKSSVETRNPSPYFKTSTFLTCTCTDNDLFLYEPRIEATC